MNVVVEQPQQALAWWIEFADRALGGEAPLIREPRTAWVHLHELNASAALLDTTVPEGAVNGLTFIFLPAGAATPYEVQRRAERWMASRPGEDGNTLEVQIRTEVLLWRRGRAVCFGSLQVTDDVRTAVTRFSFCESELVRLEGQVRDSWATLDKDLELMKRLSTLKLKHQRHIDAMARMTITMRVAHVRLQTALETPTSDLKGPARRLFLELALQAGTDHRLEMLDDAVDALDDFYLHMREQFSEFRNFLRDYRVSVLILVVLLVNDLLLLSVDRIISWLPIVTP